MKRLSMTLARLLAGLAFTGLVLTGTTAQALPPGGAGANTPGTWSRVSPTSVTAGGLLNFSVGGFPRGETLYVKIDDGKLCSDTSHGACVYHTQKIPNSGVVNGSFYLPAGLTKGSHTLRFLASAYVNPKDPGAGTAGYTNKSPAFTIKAASSSKGSKSTTTTTTTSNGTTTSTTGDGTTTTTTGSGTVAKSKAGAKAQQPSKTPASPASELSAKKQDKVTATLSDGLVVLRVGDDYAGEWAFVYAFSEPTGLGWQQVSVDGTVTVPTTELAGGEHRFAVLDVDGEVLGWTAATLPVQASASSSPVATDAEAAAPAVPEVGPGLGLWAVGGAAAVVAVASVVVWRRRRAGA